MPRSSLALSKVEADEKPVLIVFSGENNSRLGNMLGAYIELCMVCERIGKRLVFPFAEDVIGRFISFSTPSGNTDTVDQAKTLYGRLVRSAEERLEQAEGVGAYQYTPGKVHSTIFSQLGVKVLFHNGEIDWASFVAEGGLDGAHPVILKDPFPFSVSGEPIEKVLEAGRRFLSPRREVFAKGTALKAEHCPEQALDIVFHHRQSDFKQWQGGAYWYDDALMNKLVDRIYAYSEETSRAIHITVISDEEPPKELAKRKDVTFQRASLEEDFTRMACADVVFSNSSTFSKLAELVGAVYLDNRSQYFSLGSHEIALSRMDISLSEIS